MMDSPVTQRNATPNKWAGGNSCEAVLMHWWGDPDGNAQFDSVVAHLTNPAAEVSAHFVVEDGRAAQLAELGDRCWHAMQANGFTIGIEANPRKSDGDVTAVARLIAWIWAQLGRKTPIGTHNYYVNTACPGVWEHLVDDGTLENLATLIYEGKDIKMNTAQETWDLRVPNYRGNLVPAKNILAAIDGYTDTQPARVWDAPVVNRWGAAHGVRHILASMDKNIVDTLVAAKEANAKADVIVDQLKKLDGFDAAAIEAAIKDATDKIAEEAKKAMETVEITFTAKKEEGGNE